MLAYLDDRRDDRCKLTGAMFRADPVAPVAPVVSPLTAVDLKRIKDRKASARRLATRWGIDWRAIDGA
jgi:hypothetical protein